MCGAEIDLLSVERVTAISTRNDCWNLLKKYGLFNRRKLKTRSGFRTRH
jgi:hypothetical protein